MSKINLSKRVCFVLTALIVGLVGVSPINSFAGGIKNKNLPPECTAPANTCGCPEKKVGAKCIKAIVDLGETTPWTGSLDCSLKIFADNTSPSIFTADSLYAVLGGYTFKRLGTLNLNDGITPAEVVLSHPNGEPVKFVFKEGESWGQPDPGVHIKMDERLMMVDAEGWATTKEPVYYDLYPGDGSRRRFMATNMTGALGQLVSITTPQGVTMTPTDMGIDIVYDSNGVRQFITPSRLANVTHTDGWTGYDVTVYALQSAPKKDPQTGLYTIPLTQPIEVFSVRRENDGKRAIVTVQNSGGEKLRYVFDYAMGDWSLTRPTGAQEQRERYMSDEEAAKIVTSYVSSKGERLEHTEYNYKWESWGFAVTNKIEGFGGITNTTSWTYYTSGNGKGQVKTEKRQSGLLIEYAYASADRIISEKRSGPDMMTEVTTYDYTPVDPSDPVLPVDTRPRTIVKTLNGIECKRTYYVYAPLTNIVERVGTQGAAYGGTNVLRTVVAYYPVEGERGTGERCFAQGLIKSRRHEDGKLDVYDYALNDGIWIETATHVHEQSPELISGKTTRDITLTNARGEVIETRTEVFIEDVWHTIARERHTYNAEGKRIKSENLAGQITITAWDCCHKISEVQPDGSTTMWDYDDEGRMIASSRLIPMDMTNVTWLTTCYEYDDLGRQIATWQTNRAAKVGLPVTRTRYDALGRVNTSVDQLGNTTTTSYSRDARIVTAQNPNTSTRVITRSANGDTLSITGTAVTPEFHTYSILPDGTRWVKTVQGETDASPRFTKRYENMLGQVICEERSGFKGAVLATAHFYDSFGRLVSTVADYEPVVEYTYDTLGNRIAATRTVGGSSSPTTVYKKSETSDSFALFEGTVRFAQTNIVSCSDSAIAPLVTSSSRQLTGLTQTLPARSRTTDIRGNVTENELLVDSPFVTSQQIVSYATNKPQTTSRYGIELQTVSVSAVTNTIAYDYLGRQISNTDGRGNSTRVEYNAIGQRVASIDALGNRTIYKYDQFGNLTSIINPLGNAIVYEYDLRGRKTYEGGATYPVRYIYDIFGNKTTMMTYRREGRGNGEEGSVGDTTTWLYDEASGVMTNKVYADGKGPKYDYTPDGKLAKRTWARGIVTDYSYDGWGNLTNTVYSDGTPTISFFYDVLGRQTEARDAAGVTMFLSDSFGSLTNETVVGVAGTNTIERYWDGYGRTIGYALNGARQTTIGYEPDKGRIATMEIADNHSTTTTNHYNAFSWTYLPGSDLKSSLAYPNGLSATWIYDANNQLLQVCNATPTNVISQYDYTYDAVGRRVNVSNAGTAFAQNDSVAYGYNNRSELTNAVAAVDSSYRYAYDFDDIGNRETSSERGTNSVYSANQLNQYTAVDDFAPQFDDDGNQTLVKTSTGIWQVAYNAENRPVSWTCGSTNITMKFDRMGRRVEYVETVNGSTNTHHRFVYDGYLCVQRLNGASNNAVELAFGWDPTEPVATRPLWMQRVSGTYNFFYFHDGNKNVSDLVSCQSARGVTAHYEYAPFGALTAATTNTAFTAFDVAEVNPYRFSSEYADYVLGLVCYNYRGYNPIAGRWICRDLREDLSVAGLYVFCASNPLKYYDHLGLKLPSLSEVDTEKCCENGVMVEKVKVYVVNRDATNSNDADSHLDLVLPNLGLVGYFGSGGGICGKMGFRMSGHLNIGNDWCSGDTAREHYLRSHKSYICEIKVCPSAAKKMEEMAKSIHNDGGTFNFIGNNCSTVGCQILGAGDSQLNGISGIDSPQNLINQLKKKYKATCYTGCTYARKKDDGGLDPSIINVTRSGADRKEGL